MYTLLCYTPIKLTISFTTDEVTALYQTLIIEVENRLQIDKASIMEALVIQSLINSSKTILSRLTAILSKGKPEGKITLSLLDYVVLHTILIYYYGPSYKYEFYTAVGKIDQQVKQYSHIIHLSR